MFYKKKGIPEEGELVLCTVKKILPHSVFVDLDEYQNVEGMLHIAEVSPGRIRNIRDFVKEGKKIICKVLRKRNNQIDLSLRRVSAMARAKKNSEYKLEQKAEKILELIAKKLKINLEEAYKKFGYDIINEYGSLGHAFQSFVAEEHNFEDIKIPEKETIKKIIKEKVKPTVYLIERKVSLQNSKSDGIERIKKLIEKISKENKNLKIKYISAPIYDFSIESSDKKEGNQEIDKIIDNLINSLKKEGGEGSIIK